LRADADPAALAASFERAGAAAVSILVDQRFGGSVDDLRAARAATDLPLLAKGFFHSADELRTMRAAGADAVLLIMDELDDISAVRLLAAAESMGLETLVEVHDGAELDRALPMNAGIIGVNSRDLRTFQVDRKAQLVLVSQVPHDRVVVAESGIETRAHAAAAELAGADAILVGSTLMRATAPAKKLARLLARPLVKVCGLTREEDVAAAVAAGVDMVGFVLAPSPRRIPRPLPVSDGTLSVAVFVGQTGDVDTDLIQLYDEEDGHRARDGEVRWQGRPVARVVDLPWMEDDAEHWRRAASVPGRIMLAGGLGPDNVHAAVAAVKPWCVDATRSLEKRPGVKDHARIRAFVEAARCL
ncbi:MAG: bifunctional indole-3-glycerol phosphate synthase/phosphoribosylanthranilate isomerase, partial [Actinomycetota bacterium]|nr:bifunctional indole-3-glycerol phosphate synthase/phosphoribosylanthranilate isomerase [Actinomycetota bacterium]